MRRREFIIILGSMVVAWPGAPRAQQPGWPVIGFLHGGKPDGFAHVLDGFRQGLKEAGFVGGQNITLQVRWANDQLEQLPALASEMVRQRVAVLVAGGGVKVALAAKAATSTIPIVLPIGVDPVKYGLVTSLNRPAGNITGVTFIAAELVRKRVEFLRELLPQTTIIAFLSAPGFASMPAQVSDAVAAAQALGRQIVVVEARSERDFDAAFTTVVQRGAGGCIVGGASLFTSNREKLLTLAASHKVPTIYQYREYVMNGGLASYGASIAEAYRLSGGYVGQILKGAKPGDLPFQQSTKIELVINLKTAKALGLSIPPTLLARADEVIE